MHKPNSIRMTLFLTFSLIITVTFVALVSFFFAWGSGELREGARMRLDAAAESISANLDAEVRKMDDVSISVLYSNLVKDRFIKYLSEPEKVPNASPNSGFVGNEKELADVILAIIGPSLAARQINLYDFDGAGFGTGRDNRPRSLDLGKTPWFGEAVAAGGTMVLSPPHPDEKLSRYATMRSADTERFISLDRVMFNRYRIPLGVVETEQSCDTIFGSLERESANGGNNERVVVLDGKGGQLYPIPPQDDPDIGYYYGVFRGLAGTPDPARAAVNPRTGRRELLRFKTSEYSGWTVVVIADERTLLAPLVLFTWRSLIIALVILILALLLSFIAARRITLPLARIHEDIRAVDIGSLGTMGTFGSPGSADTPDTAGSNRTAGSIRTAGSGLNELEELDLAFRGMRLKLRKSIDQLIATQRREVQARMLALQSQMNPHFLYNTIATISILAEEGMNAEAVALCGNVSGMLRYLSSQKSMFAEAAAELDYTRAYLDCIKLRQGKKLSYSLVFDQAFASVRIPKLVIQPIVENSVKYGTLNEPPWAIGIEARVGDGRWSVRVEDDGPGFGADVLERLANLVSGLETAGEFRGLELDGMGLANIAARIALAYGERGVFFYGNRPSGGAFVEIGGPVEGAEGERDAGIQAV
jgi:two-component system, sensor histidine kinase YesM